MKIGNNSKLAKFIEKRIKEHKSPAAVAQNIRESDKFDIELHWKTIYNYIDKEILDLDREEFGHWEMDLVEDLKEKGKPFLLVLTERQTRQEIIEKILNKKSESVVKGLDRIERRFVIVNFRKIFKTITTDNGSEFADYERIEESFTGSRIPRTSQYYCDAYCSWQRGSNEVANKFIRRFLPKGTSFKGITRTLVKKIQKFINTYPRKCLLWKLR